ncbi:ABC transporter substrate-binding protein [Prauserella muralis]|uniref:Fe3+-hydroxamate ABC transporter substrate-binding protein n=1 Tax=Prauserella muralis TaxID=588067 RepID=A0A2V4AMG6_9PSEU|nr:ABC transporter substrate-binding protein [Prauserella muralis]PXY21233.1 Fe3+-hydroxamate ABC transporter substrate-binding protein [Prauserella muralis]TWE30343.1 iron complex transport system substrate-binding protein [Prauserella muralis]
MASTLSRRTVLGGLALTATGLLAACGGGSRQATSGSGAWSFTDDTGRTAELDRRPTRIAGLNDAIASLWNYGVVPVASFGYTALEDDVNFEGRDVSKVTQVGRTYGEIDVEALAAQQPDLILTHAYPVDSSGKLDAAKPLYGFKDLKQQETVAAIAPIVALAMRGSATGVVARTAEFASAVGVSRATLDGHRKDYDAARQRLRKATGSGLTAMAVAAYPAEGVHIAKAVDDPALRSYTELGLKYPDPGGDAYYWQQVSWENIGEHRTDVVLYSLRAMTGKELLEQPTFARLPAAAAGQVFPWEFSAMDYVAQARTIDRLAANLEKSRKVT